MFNKNLIPFLLLFSCVQLISQGQETFKYEKTGSGKVVILIPGLGNSGDVWDEFADQLSDNYLCYKITLAGFAGEKLTKEFSYANFTEELIEFVTKENLKNPVLIGHSYGGFLSLKLAGGNPGKFSKLVIVDSYPFVLGSLNPAITSELAKQQAAVYKNVILNQQDKEYEETQRTAFSAAITDKDDLEKIIKWVLNSDRKAIAEATYEMIANDLRSELKNITAKTLILGTWIARKQYGYTKESTRKTFKEQYSNLKNKNIIIADDSRHFIMLDEPEWFYEKVSNFIK